VAIADPDRRSSDRTGAHHHDTRGTDVAAQRGGRRRATKQDTVRDALLAALADALDVDAERLTVTVALDDAPVPADRLPLTLELVPETANEQPSVVAEQQEADKVENDEAERRAATPSRRSERDRAADEVRDASPVTAEELDEEAEAAADLLEGLLDAMDLPGDLRISVQDAHAEVEVIGLEEGVLIGRRGQTLDAVQELVRTAMQRRFERRSRVLVDVDGYRARRLEKLLERADEAVQEVLATGQPQRLEPMDAIERRLVHQRVAETPGVVSNSHGREPSRRIVIEPSDD
jgi:spoIIIJ-associated protein